MSNELVQLVVQLYEKNWGVKDYGLARAVVAMCMEEAAKFCDIKAKHRWGDGYDCCDAALQQTAAAIRALKDK